MNQVASKCDQIPMSETDLEKRLSDLERRHEKTRGLLIDAVSLAVLGLIGLYFKPHGYSAIILGFCLGLSVPRLLSWLFLREGRLIPISRFDGASITAAAIGLLILIAATTLFFVHPIAHFGV